MSQANLCSSRRASRNLRDLCGKRLVRTATNADSAHSLRVI
jgi:hypothetical protein